jgi:hypothetical protein
MPIKGNCIYKEVGGEYMLIPLEGNNVNMSKVFNLNEVGAFIYRKLKEKDDASFVALELTKEYAVEYDEALADVKAFMESLKERGLYE